MVDRIVQEIFGSANTVSAGDVWVNGMRISTARRGRKRAHIEVDGGDVIIDGGKEYKNVLKVTIELADGTKETELVDEQVNIVVKGNAGNIECIYGHVTAEKVEGDVETTNGRVTVQGDVGGSCKTTNGNITARNIGKKAKTVNGKISQ